jgi:hypothetical protein
MSTEMEFLDINLSKIFCSMNNAIRSPFYTGGTLKKIILSSGFKNPYKKSVKQENASLFMNSIL